jgi:hypothetical protein
MSFSCIDTHSMFAVIMIFRRFLVGGDGNVYEGRGWHQVGAHTYGFNKRSIGIAMIGEFSGKNDIL